MNARARTPIAASLAIALLAACSERTSLPSPSPARTASASAAPSATFPELPVTTEAVAELVRRETARPIAPERAADAAAILAAIAARPAAIVAGDRAMTRWIQSFLDRAGGDAYVLVGTWHDAPGQIDAFRRLVGPGGLRGLDVVAVELFRADGAWAGAPLELQRGDGAAIAAYLDSGDREAFAGLALRHRDGDYAAWKLGFEPSALDLLVNARATAVRLLGCDMPQALQERSGAPPGDLRNRLREIHCLHALPPPLPGRPRRAALLWGDAHVQPGGLRRFLPTAAAVLSLHVLGRRMEPGPAETALARELSVVEPALVPLGPEEAVILLPDATLGGRIDRVLARAEPGEAVPPGLSVRTPEAGVLSSGERSMPVGPEGVTLGLPEGDHTYMISAGRRRVVGAVRIEAGHRVELGFDPRAGLVSYVERVPH
jgi:hypothetical protein